MELDFSEDWRIIGGEGLDGPAAFAAEELASVLGRIIGRPVHRGGTDVSERIIILYAGKRDPSKSPGGRKHQPRFSWRASSDRVELYGEDGFALLRAAYDFLAALGANWPEPGPEAEGLPHGPLLRLEAPSWTSDDRSLPATLILGHAVFLEDWRERLLWAVRSGYSSVFIHTTPDPLAMGAIPGSLYEALRPEIAAEAQRLGLTLELGGHWLSSFLPRSLFRSEPGLFREKDGTRTADHNLCPSSDRALELAVESFASWAEAHPEAKVLHAWPDDLPSGGYCGCARCSGLAPAAQSLKIARTLAAALAERRPEATLSFLAYHDTEDAASALGGAEALPSNLELLWAPRMRCWGHGLDARECSLNARSIEAFRANARAWRRAGGGRVAVFEYWEDAVLFKGAVPPLVSTMMGDIAAYRGSSREEGADAVGVLCTGGRLPLAPRPNVCLLPRLAAGPDSGEGRAEATDPLARWALAAYGEISAPMLRYWRDLEAAWAMDLELEEGETGLRESFGTARDLIEPPVDWGDPWRASSERLIAKLDRCEDLFDRLRSAESALAEAKELARSRESADPRVCAAVLAEAAEYAISGSLLELNCARLSVRSELSGGDPRAAADLANLALSASGAARKALRTVPSRRARREIGFLISVYYDLALRAARRANARSGARRLLDLWLTGARLAWTAWRVSRAYAPRGLARRELRR
jgi:hypothetical protein